MARKNQKLINYHTSSKTAMPSGSSVDFGEIVVRHNAETPELLIKIGDDSFGVFQASGAVQTAIDSVSSATKTLVSDVSAATVATYATKEELKSTSGSIITAYTTAIGNLTSDLNELSGVVSSITENYVTNSTLNTTVETLEGKISSAKTEAIGKASGYTDTQIAAAKEYSDGKLSAATETLKGSITTLSGNVETAIQNLETGLTKTINEKVATAYRFQGSCTYAELASKEKVNGYVWNVTDAHDNVPAGTNYAWSEDENKWDALGGIVDLSPYATTTYVDGKIQEINQTNTDLKSDIDSLSSATKTLIDEVSAATKATYATKTELEATSGSIISDYTTAIGAAKKAVYDSATTVAAADAKTKADTAYSSAVTAAAASANTLQNNINTVNSSVTGLSASTVSIETTANSAIQTASIVDKDTCKVSVNKVNTELQFDFSNLVIDCGDF